MIKSYGKYILSVIGAAYFGLLLMLLVTIPFRLMLGSNRNAVNGISSACCVIASMVMLLFLTKKFGYDEQKPDRSVMDKKTILQCVAAVVVYDVLTVIFRYYTGAATNVAYLAGIFGSLDQELVNIKEMAREHGGLMFLSLVIQTIPFIPPMLAGYYLGGKKRGKERAKFHEDAK